MPIKNQGSGGTLIYIRQILADHTKDKIFCRLFVKSKIRDFLKVNPTPPKPKLKCLQVDLIVNLNQMQFEGAVIKEQGVTFAIVVVKSYVLNSKVETNKTRSAFQSYFPGVPIILMARDGHSTPTYQGRKDIVHFLSHISPSRIPWKKYTVN